MKKILIASLLLSFSFSAVASPSHSGMNEIFSETISPLSSKNLSNFEMQETEGKIAPLIYLVGSYAVRGGIKYYIKKQLTRKEAIKAVKKGGSVYVKNNQTAKTLAKLTYGKKNAVKHITHKRSDVWKPHYQTSPNPSGSHIFYGK